VDDATRKVVDSLPHRTGRSFEEWSGILEMSGLQKHMQLVTHLKEQHGVTHGFANAIVLLHRERDTETSADDWVDAQYAGAKSALRPIHDRLVEVVRAFGDDVDVAPKRTSVSLRRSKQFALIEPASAQRIVLGIALGKDWGDARDDGRLTVWGGMCSHRVDVRGRDEIDDELVSWVRAAYDRC